MIDAESILQTLPDVLRNDTTTLLLCSVIANELAKRPPEIEKLRIFTQISTLPDELLDILASDFKVDWWDANYTTLEKRRVLSENFAIHRMLGTKAAVEDSLSAIYANTTVVDGVDYDGQPYHFKIIIDTNYEGSDSEKHERVMQRVNLCKNVRSVLDAVEYQATPMNATYYVGAAIGGSSTRDTCTTT